MQVLLAAGESTITRGQPAVFEGLPASDTVKWAVKLCPDGGRPDVFITTSVDLGGINGLCMVRHSSVGLALVGENVKRGDLLSVKGGKLCKAVAGTQAWARAMFDGNANDLINIEPADTTA
jgi:hypothetical protein